MGLLRDMYSTHSSQILYLLDKTYKCWKIYYIKLLTEQEEGESSVTGTNKLLDEKVQETSTFSYVQSRYQWCSFLSIPHRILT